MSAQIILTDRQRELARHALGLPNRTRKSFRNWFVAEPGHTDYEDWQFMVAIGAATGAKVKQLVGDCFWLTRQGAEAALQEGDRLDPEDFR